MWGGGREIGGREIGSAGRGTDSNGSRLGQVPITFGGERKAEVRGTSASLSLPGRKRKCASLIFFASASTSPLPEAAYGSGSGGRTINSTRWAGACGGRDVGGGKVTTALCPSSVLALCSTPSRVRTATKQPTSQCQPTPPTSNGSASPCLPTCERDSHCIWPRSLTSTAITGLGPQGWITSWFADSSSDPELVGRARSDSEQLLHTHCRIGG